MPKNIITKSFDPVEAPRQGTPLAYFLCFGCKPPQYLNLIPKFLTNVRKHFKGFSQKDFIAPRNQRTNPKLTEDMKKQLHYLKVSWHFCECSDDAFLETQIHDFCQKYPDSHIVLISANKSFCQRIYNDKQLEKHPKYLIHDLELKDEDSALMQKATDAFHMDYFLDSSPHTITALDNQFNPVEATHKDTPLILLIDIENIPKPKLLIQVIDEVLKHFRGFDVQKYIGALTKESYNKLKEVHTELHKSGLELHSVEKKKNSADNYLIEKAMTSSRDFPNACFVIMTSDCDFCRCVINLRYYYNHDVYSIPGMWKRLFFKRFRFRFRFHTCRFRFRFRFHRFRFHQQKTKKRPLTISFNFCGSVACLLHFIILRKQKPSFIAITLPTSLKLIVSNYSVFLFLRYQNSR